MVRLAGGLCWKGPDIAAFASDAVIASDTVADQSQSLRPGQHPEPDFYAKHLIEMTQSVAGWLGIQTQAPTAVLVRCVLALSADAQRLLARMLSRKHGLLRQESLYYPEVVDTEAALVELERAGLLERQPMQSGSRQLALLRKDELLTIFEQELLSIFEQKLPGLRQQRKAALIAAVVEACPDALIHRRLQGQFQWVSLLQAEQFQLVTLLYFGDQRGALSQFVTEALGIVSYPAVVLTPPQLLVNATADPGNQGEDPVAAALGNLRALLIQCDLSHRICAALSHSRELPETARQRRIVVAWRLAAALLSTNSHTLLSSRRQRALLRLGQGFERTAAWWPALRCLQGSGLPPATERSLRILWRIEQQPAARLIARSLLHSKPRAVDREFAQSLLRHGIRRRNGRAHEIRVNLVEAPYARPIEQQALDLLLQGPATGGESKGARANGKRAPGPVTCGWHCENLFPLGLAGLIYWPVLYAPVEGAFTRRFQTTPHGLGAADFLETRQLLLEDLERPWTQQPEGKGAAVAQLIRHLREQHESNAGSLNPLVSWQFWSRERLDQLLRHVDPLLLFRLARFTLHNLADYRTGFPDLVICSGGGRFICVEVKGPNDTLQPMQRQWLRALEALDIEAYVLKVTGDGPR